jgi:uncharacterized membrane protein YgaE (UPF0421/DUF939 family)
MQRPTAGHVKDAVLRSAVVAAAGLVSYWLVASGLSRLHSISPTDDIVGGLWAAISAIFVSKNSDEQSQAAGISRVAATLVSFPLCLLYLLFLPFHLWGFALVIGLSVLIPMLLGRPGDAATAAITSAVLLALAPLSPQHAWEQPILRFADTIVGAAVGVAAAWLMLRLPGRAA